MTCMVFMVVLLLTAASGAESQAILNFTADAEAAMADMRAKSYFGFIILLKALINSPNFIHTSDVTFLVPTDDQLAAPQLNLDLQHLADFVLAHTIPTPLLFNNLMHFPNGTMVPSTLPGKMLTFTTNHGLFVDTAKIVNPNVCVNSMIKCHGISSVISFVDPPPTGDTDLKRNFTTVS